MLTPVGSGFVLSAIHTTDLKNKHKQIESTNELTFSVMWWRGHALPSNKTGDFQYFFVLLGYFVYRVQCNDNGEYETLDRMMKLRLEVLLYCTRFLYENSELNYLSHNLYMKLWT